MRSWCTVRSLNEGKYLNSCCIVMSALHLVIERKHSRPCLSSPVHKNLARREFVQSWARPPSPWCELRWASSPRWADYWLVSSACCRLPSTVYQMNFWRLSGNISNIHPSSVQLTSSQIVGWKSIFRKCISTFTSMILITYFAKFFHLFIWMLGLDF